MPNIKFNYLYRDGANYKNFNSIIFANPTNIDLSELTLLIKSKLIGETWFYVDEWGLPDLHFRLWDNEIDTDWHEFQSIKYTDEIADPLFFAEDFRFLLIKTPWRY